MGCIKIDMNLIIVNSKVDLKLNIKLQYMPTSQATIMRRDQFQVDLGA